jgi:pimeloyl-ACP methyl ester carboxylesterase
MGHGFCAEWRFGTAQTIADFTAAGYAVFSFDYRHFGESQGEPRQLLNVGQQLEDWHAALACVRAEARTDTQRLVIWGSSLGGGHVLSIAAHDNEVAAVLAQVPHCDARAASPNINKLSLLRTIPHVLLDNIFALFGKVHCIPVVAEPGQPGALTFPGWRLDYLKLVPAGSHWRNALPARSLATIASYSPRADFVNIQCPVFIYYAANDLGVPSESVEAAAAGISQVELHRYPGDHFDVYNGEHQLDCMARQLSFLARVLT